MRGLNPRLLIGYCLQAQYLQAGFFLFNLLQPELFFPLELLREDPLAFFFGKTLALVLLRPCGNPELE